MGSTTLTLFTSSASPVTPAPTAIGIAVKSELLPLITSINKVNNRIVYVVFKGNPKTYVISCYSPHNNRPEDEVIKFYSILGNYLSSVPDHAFVSLCDDFNAKIGKGLSYHNVTNRKGQHLLDFLNQHNLVAINTRFQKAKRKLWSWRSTKGELSQIDYILCRKRWQNSILDSQAYSSSNVIASDHRIVSLKARLNLRFTRPVGRRTLNWATLSSNNTLAQEMDVKISSEFNSLPKNMKSYDSFLRVCNKLGKDLLPPKARNHSSIADCKEIIIKRAEVFHATVSNTQAEQTSVEGVLRQIRGRKD